jgi:DNA-binding transcriptional ArsR family regulator
MPNQIVSLNRVFQALADPTRRAVIERLTESSAPVGALAQPFRMTLPSFTQHLDMLENCGLVVSSKSGRVRTYSLAPESLRPAEDWMSERRTHWERRLDQLDAFLNTGKEPKP